MTDESESNTEPFVKDTGMKYAYVYDSGQAFGRELGVTGFPTAWLVDPSGTVVWKGHPAELDASTIEAHLDGALKTPVFEWPASLSSVRKSFLRKQYADAIEAAKKAAPDEPAAGAVAASLEKMVESRARSIRSAFDKGDYLVAYESGSDAVKELAGLPAADGVKEVVDSIRKDRDAQAILKAQKVVRKLVNEPVRSAGAAKDAIEQLDRIVKHYPDSVAAREAQAQIDNLRKSFPR